MFFLSRDHDVLRRELRRLEWTPFESRTFQSEHLPWGGVHDIARPMVLWRRLPERRPRMRPEGSSNAVRLHLAITDIEARKPFRFQLHLAWTSSQCRRLVSPLVNGSLDSSSRRKSGCSIFADIFQLRQVSWRTARPDEEIPFAECREVHTLS
jgi:hypothetical protein